MTDTRNRLSVKAGSYAVTHMTLATKQIFVCTTETYSGKDLGIPQQTQEVKMGLCLAGHLDNPKANSLNIFCVQI